MSGRESHVLTELAEMQRRRRTPGLLVTFARILLFAFLVAILAPLLGCEHVTTEPKVEQACYVAITWRYFTNSATGRPDSALVAIDGCA